MTRTEHDCIDHLVSRSHSWVEPHGEPCYQEWDECSVCGELFDESNPPPERRTIDGATDQDLPA